MHARVRGVGVEDVALEVGDGHPELHGLHGNVEGAQEALALLLEAHVLEEGEHVGDHPVLEDGAAAHAKGPDLPVLGRLRHLVQHLSVLEDPAEAGQEGLVAGGGQDLRQGASQHVLGRPAEGSALALRVPGHDAQVAVHNVEADGQGLQRGPGDAVALDPTSPEL